MRAESALAVVGMACRLPGASNLDALWNNVVRDVYSIRPLPPDRFNHARYFHPEVGAYAKSYSAIGGLVDDVPLDAAALGLDADALATMDTAHRWALGVAQETLADAGLEPGALRGRNVGVLIGHARGSMLTSDLAFATAVEGLIPSLGALPGVAPDAQRRATEAALAELRRRYPSHGARDLGRTLASGLAGRIAQTFGFTGRHAVVDAACASSFAALDLAARALRRGQIDVALTGGASYSQELSVVLFAQSRALSGDGSFPFDERANGFVSSDGFGFFLLMRLDDAVRRGLRIRAVIRGVGGSCDGKGKALWAPRKEGQVLAMRRAHAEAELDPATLGLLEAHATSTPVGDATEIQAVQEVFGPARGVARPLPIGSIKGNIGHAREAAGAAGLLKVILAMEHGVLPPSGNLRTPSPQIPWDDVVARPVRAAEAWPSGVTRRAAVNAFGIGGLNYHVVVEEPPARSVLASSLGVELVPTVTLPAPPAAPATVDVAIVGIGARLPGAPSFARFGERLLADEDGLVDVPPARWPAGVFVDPTSTSPYRAPTGRGGFVTGFAPDWRRYKMPPKLVEQNDPLQFMLLESASDALAAAGVELASIDRTRVATLMGTSFGSDFALELSLAIRAPELGEALAAALGRAGDASIVDATTAALRRHLPTIDEDSSGSFSSSTLASRIAKTLDLMGPTYTLDAACDAALTTVEAACELLRTGGADLVVAGAGDRAMRAQRFATYAQAGLLTPRARPTPLSPEADGLLPAEGAVVFALERLEDAERHGHPVLAVIRAVASASEPRALEVGRPPVEAERLAARRALGAVSSRLDDVAFVEAHALGARAWDAAELDALAEGYARRSAPLVVTGTKGLTGHAMGAAGGVALAAAVTALGARRAVGSVVTVDGAPASRAIEGPLAAVASMSFGGSSHHVVLERGAAPSDRRAAPAIDLGRLVLVQGDDWSQLRAHTRRDALGPIEAAALGPFARVQRAGQGAIVAAFAVDDDAQLDERLALLARTADPRPARGLLAKQGVLVRDTRAAIGGLAFTFSGQGAQYGGMHRALVELLPAAAEVLARAERWLVARGRAPMRAVMFADKIPDDVFWVQASLLVADLVALEAARAVGLEPDVCTGHSYGDYAALVATGAWSLETALAATELRARGIEASVEPGGMLSAAAPRARVEALVARLLAEHPEAPRLGTLVASNVNAPLQTVLSGSPAALEAAARFFAAEGVETRRVDIPRAFHSPLMAAARGPIREGLGALPLGAPVGRFVSSVSGRDERDPEIIRALLVEQLTVPVDFVGQLERLLTDGVTSFVECGPRGLLTSFTQDVAAARGAEIVALTVDDAARPGRFALQRLAVLAATRALEAPQVAADRGVHGGTRAEGAVVRPTEAPPPAITSASAPVRSTDGASARPSHVRRSGDTGLPTPAPGDEVLLFVGDEASALAEAPGFEAFWARTQPTIADMVRTWWSSERQALEVAERERAAREAAERAAQATPARGRSRRPARAEGTTLPTPLAAPLTGEGARTEPPPPSAPVVSRDEIQRFIVDAIASHTGYPTELIDPSADLEADLGVDTVKQAQVLGKARDRFQLKADRALSLADFNTVEKIVGYIEREQASRPRDTRPRLPVVDLTARRSTRPQVDEARPTIAAPRPPEGATTRVAPAAPAAMSATPPSAPASTPAAPPIAAPAAPPIAAPAAAPIAAPAAPALAVAPAAALTATPASTLLAAPAPAPLAAPTPSPRAIAPARAPSTPVVVLELRGDARTIGRQHGEALRDVIRETMDRYEAFLGDHGLRSLDVPEATRFLPTLFDDDALDELRGVAEAARLPFEHLLAYNLDAALFPAFTPGCTQFVRTARVNGGRLLHAINEDSPLLVHLGTSETRVVQRRVRTDLPRPRATTLFSLAGQLAGPNAANDRGLTITSTTLLDGALPSGLPTGSPHPLLVKRIVEHADALADVERIVAEARRTGRWSVLASSVAEDRAVYVEYDGATLLHRRDVTDALVSTNHALEPTDAARAPEHSKLRLARAVALFHAGPVTREGAERGLRDQHDLGRGRAVRHPTMNTVRRVDNVMSLVVDPAAGELRVSARVDPPGTPDDVPMEFLTLPIAVDGDGPRGRGAQALSAQAAPSIPGDARGVSRLSSLGAVVPGVVAVNEQMRRAVIRLVPEARVDVPAARRTVAGRHALVVGQGRRADALEAALRARGARVSRAVGPHEVTAPPDVDLLALATSPASTRGDATQRRAALDAWFTFAQRHADRALAGVVAVVELGGGLGFANLAEGAPEDGALVGLLKAWRRERDGLAIVALDAAPAEPPDAVASLALDELEAGAPRLEVALLRGRRLVPTLPDRPLDATALASASTDALPTRWLLTGGARGVTAVVARRLAALGARALVLVGRAAAPDAAWLARYAGLEGPALTERVLAELRAAGSASPLELKARMESLERAREIAATLAELRALEVDVRYEAVALEDAAAVAAMLARVGPIEGLVHGAGVEVAKAFAKKTVDGYRATLGAKLDGWESLRPLLTSPSLRVVVAFSSVSGRFGGHGQTDYAMANEGLARAVGALRLARPDVRATAIAWPAWDEVGMAARGSARTFLEQTGQAFMSPAEGANHFVRELLAGLPEPEVVIHGELSALDLDHTLVPVDARAGFDAAAREVASSPLLGALVSDGLGGTRAEARLVPTRPFLDEHRMGTTPILPAVIGLEGLLELVALESERYTVAELEIVAPLKVGEGGVDVAWTRDGEQLTLSARVERSDGVVLDPTRPFMRAVRRPRVPLRAAPVLDRAALERATWLPFPYPSAPDATPGARTIFHGPAFRTLTGVARLGDGLAVARLVAPPPAALQPGSDPARWRVPAAVLDGCLQAVGLLSRLEDGVFALPQGFGRVDVAPALELHGGEPLEALIRRRVDGERVIAEIDVLRDGVVIVSIERYAAQIVRPT